MSKAFSGLAIAAIVLGCASHSRAGDIFGFGDSQLDAARLCMLTGNPYGACTNGMGVLQSLGLHTGLAYQRSNNDAVGGVQSGDGSLYGFPFTNGQVTEFVSAGRTFRPDDLVVFSAFTNNYVRLIRDPSLTGEALAATTLAENRNSISRLIAAGARNMIVYGGGDVSTIYASGSARSPSSTTPARRSTTMSRAATPP